jgi:hypothetical protein
MKSFGVFDEAVIGDKQPSSVADFARTWARAEVGRQRKSDWKGTEKRYKTESACHDDLDVAGQTRSRRT